jgi:demethylmenaquinone methyltransferase/2-methoxy-6-polyprenyl-1,4-benzoquinol methylase
MFSAIADRYDLFNSVSSFNRDGYWRRFAVSHTDAGRESLVLDVGAGTGKLVAELVSGCGARAIGVDLCGDMLTKARGVAAEGTAGFAMARAESLPFPDGVFDCAVSGFTLRNVSDLELTLEEMARVLKVGGRMVLLEFTPPARNVTGLTYRAYLATLLPLMGLALSRRRDPYTYLRRSIKEFERPDDLTRRMTGAGIGNIEVHLLTLGTVAVHVGTKRDPVH